MQQNSVSKSLAYVNSIILGESYNRVRSIDILNVSDSKAISGDYAAVYKNYSISLAKMGKKENVSKKTTREKTKLNNRPVEVDSVEGEVVGNLAQKDDRGVVKGTFFSGPLPPP